MNGAQRLDEFCVCHPSHVLALSRDPLGERGAWNRSAMTVRGFVGPRHRNYLDAEQRPRSSDYCRCLGFYQFLADGPDGFVRDVKHRGPSRQLFMAT